jgi:hypothetical protein
MVNFSELSKNTSHPLWKEVYGILSRGQQIRHHGYTADGIGNHSIEDINGVQHSLWEHILTNKINGGERIESLRECQDRLIFDVKKAVRGARDGIYNPISGLGTISDPDMFTGATIPVSISPFEATALYAGGGLPAIIIDKKSKGVLVNGITFKTYNEDFWSDERQDKLIKEIDRTGFDEKISVCLRDSTLYGGAILYPVFKEDNIGSFREDIEDLIRSGVIGKGCISRWAVVDRWNTVYVCNYDPTASDYLNPRSLYVPISGIELNTKRCSVIKLKEQPYWGAIRQLGWGVSDLEGYIRSIYSYYVMAMSMPIMAQQMSLVLYQIPLDAVNAEIGVDNVEKLMKINEDHMREWSIVHPKIVNLVGEIKTIERTFSGFEQFYNAVITDLCARAEMPRPLLFHTPNKGFSDNTTESLLKESEMMRMRQKEVEPLLVEAKNILIAHTFGTDSEEWRNADDIYISFDKPVVATDKDKAEIGARYSATVNNLRMAGVPTKDALVLSKQFFTSVRLSVNILDNSEAAYEKEVKMMESKKNGDDGVDMRGGTALNGKPAQIRSGGNTSSKAKDDGLFNRLIKKIYKYFYEEEDNE